MGMIARVFQHVPYEWLGSIEPWLQANRFQIQPTRFFAGETPPSDDNYDWLIVLGGPMNIYQYSEHPWLKIEKDAIARALDSGKTLLAICLGAQLLADVLGGETSMNLEKEIGWYPVQFYDHIKRNHLFQRFPEELTVFHWHGDTFDIPDGALEIAQSTACKNQAFVYEDNAVGLQFHLETTLSSAQELIAHSLDEIVNETYIQQPEFMLSQTHLFPAINNHMEKLLNALLEKTR